MIRATPGSPPKRLWASSREADLGLLGSAGRGELAAGRMPLAEIPSRGLGRVAALCGPTVPDKAWHEFGAAE